MSKPIKVHPNKASTFMHTKDKDKKQRSELQQLATSVTWACNYKLHTYTDIPTLVPELSFWVDVRTISALRQYNIAVTALREALKTEYQAKKRETLCERAKKKRSN